MKRLLLFIVTITLLAKASAQTIVERREKLDTNRIVYDEQGNALHYYQYTKLLNTGDYRIKLNGPPDAPGTKSFIIKTTPQEQLRMYQFIKDKITIKSPLLKEGSTLDVTPLQQAFRDENFDKKVVILVFWNASCPPCTESFASINDLFRQINNPQNIEVIAITPDDEKTAIDKLKEKPLLYAKLISGGWAVMNAYQLKSYPSYVVADRDHVIRYAVTGNSSVTISMLKNSISQILYQ